MSLHGPASLSRTGPALEAPEEQSRMRDPEPQHLRWGCAERPFMLFILLGQTRPASPHDHYKHPRPANKA